MKIDLSGEMNSFLGYFICHVIEPVFEAAKKSDGKISYRADDLDLVVTINTVEVDALSFVDHIEKQMNRMIEERAKELVQERIPTLFGRLVDLEQRIEEEIDKAFPLARKED